MHNYSLDWYKNDNYKRVALSHVERKVLWSQRVWVLDSSHVREFQNPGNVGYWNPESGKILLVKSGILGFGIWNTALGIGNAINDWNSKSKVPLTKTGVQYQESGIQCVKSRIQNCLGFPYVGRLKKVVIFFLVFKSGPTCWTKCSTELVSFTHIIINASVQQSRALTHMFLVLNTQSIVRPIASWRRTAKRHAISAEHRP